MNEDIIHKDEIQIFGHGAYPLSVNISNRGSKNRVGARKPTEER